VLANDHVRKTICVSRWDQYLGAYRDIPKEIVQEGECHDGRRKVVFDNEFVRTGKKGDVVTYWMDDEVVEVSRSSEAER